MPGSSCGSCRGHSAAVGAIWRRLMRHPGIAKSQFGDDPSEAACEIGIRAFVQFAGWRSDDGNPIVLGGSVDRQPEFGRPPIRLTLVDQGNQFRGCPFGAIDDFHENERLYFAMVDDSREIVGKLAYPLG